MNALWYLLVSAVAYLLGSFNTAIVVSKAVFHRDIRTEGSKNAGFTNAFRVMGSKWGFLVALGDVVKGVLAVGFAVLLPVDPELGRLLAGIFAILGHVFPVYFGFKGGKGVITTATVMLIVDPFIALIAIGIFAGFAVSTRYVSLGSIFAALSLPFTSYFAFHRSWLYVVLMSLIAATIVILHRQNIKRLLKGEERKFSFSRKKL